MKFVIQRVKNSKVEIEGKEFSSIGRGVLVLFCAEAGDEEKDLEYFANKILKLRIFEDESGKMNLSLIDILGEILIVSQFTLAANCKKGTRPSFEGAMEPVRAKKMYEKFIETVNETYVKLLQDKGSNGQSNAKTAKTGVFGADMKVSLLNDGPVTIIL